MHTREERHRIIRQETMFSWMGFWAHQDRATKVHRMERPLRVVAWKEDPKAPKYTSQSRFRSTAEAVQFLESDNGRWWEELRTNFSFCHIGIMDKDGRISQVLYCKHTDMKLC